jgi:hypothetical protein
MDYNGSFWTILALIKFCNLHSAWKIVANKLVPEFAAVVTAVGVAVGEVKGLVIQRAH